MPTRANLAATVVATAPSPASSGTTLTVATGKGARFATPPFNATIGPASVSTVAFAEQAEIVRVTKVTGDELTISRAFEGPNPARSVVVGDIVAETITVNEAESALAYAPAPSGGDDSKAIQEVYEGMGKAGILQLRAGTYKFDTGVKFRKYGVWLRGQGAAAQTIKSDFLASAGTLITCNSKNTAAIEVSQSGSTFSDFALQNNFNTELGLLSEALNSAGAAITELPVKALAAAIPNGTVVSTVSHVELASVSTALSTAANITSFKVNAIPNAILANSLITLNDGSFHIQNFELSAEAAKGATEIKVVSNKPTFAFPIGTKVEPAVQQWTMTAEAKAADTKIKVTSQKPTFSFAAETTKIEGGPFEGAYGIQNTRLNAEGVETTEGNSFGRHYNLFIEGFYVDWKAIAGIGQSFQSVQFYGAVKFGVQYGDPNNSDAGSLFFNDCLFGGTKKRKPTAYFRWESGGGIFIQNCEFVFGPENNIFLPEVAVDFLFEPPAKTATSNLWVSGCQIEGYERAGVRFVCGTNAEVTLANCGVVDNEIRSFSGNAERAGVRAESGAAERLSAVCIVGNRLNQEGGKSAVLKNVSAYNVVGNVGNANLTLEGSSSTGQLGYPIFTPAATSTTMSVSHPGGPNSYWLTVYLELKPGELAEYEVKSGTLTVLAKVTEQAPQPLIYGYCEAIAGGEITEIKCKALIFTIPNATKIKVVSFENPAIFTEFKTTAEAKVGETKISVEKVAAEIIPANSPVEAAAPEKYLIQNGPFFFPPSAPYELKRLGVEGPGNNYKVLVSKTIAS